MLPYRGKTFLETVLAQLRAASLERIAVVLGHHAEQIRGAVNLDGVEVVVNRDYKRGQTSSLQAGLRALNSPDLEAIVLCLVDHPAFSAEVVTKLVAVFRQSKSPVAIPTFQNQRGHPVLIARALFAELSGLGAEAGANTIIHKYRDKTEFIEVDDGGILIDIDDPQSYRKLEA